MSLPEAEDRETLIMIPVGPVIDVSRCQISLLAIRYSVERPPRFVFLLADTQADWVQERVH